MDKKNAYQRPRLSEPDRFFAKLVRNWVMHPENDPDLTDEIKSGKHPGLEILVEEDDCCNQ